MFQPTETFITTQATGIICLNKHCTTQAATAKEPARGFGEALKRGKSSDLQIGGTKI